MELYSLKVFLTVANEKSFSRAAERLLRTQPAISLAVQRLETELGEKLIDRSSTPPMLTDAGRTVLEYARRFENLESEMQNALAELRDNASGKRAILFNAYDDSGYWGISDNDRTHVLNFHYLYELPFWRSQDTVLKKILGGWQVSGVTFFQSGKPLTVWGGLLVAAATLSNTL